MTTETLRKAIIVQKWSLNHKGMTVSYERTDGHLPKTLHLILSPLETVKRLYSMACIDGYNDAGELKVDSGGVTYSWDSFTLNYKTCQWEALNIAIKHEGGKELDNDINMLEIDSALKALI
jgi:hypothetical protein